MGRAFRLQGLGDDSSRLPAGTDVFPKASWPKEPKLED